MSLSKMPLPFRRLKEYANGIWDEERQAFYHYKVSNATVPAIPGIAFYVRNAEVAIQNNGDAASSNSSWTMVVGGTSKILARVVVGATIAAGPTSSVASCVSQSVNVLADVNTALTLFAGGIQSLGNIVYAEIPADIGGYDGAS